MESKSDGRRQPATVSGLRPGDFALGSLESRAAARAMLDAREADEAKQTELSDEDLDALVVYRESRWLTARTSPDHHDLEPLPIYKRGKEVHEAFYGKAIPVHEDPHYQRSTAASFAFELAFHKEPEPGDILRYTDVQANYAQSIADVPFFTEMWKQRLPNLPCPLRIEGDKLFCRMKPERGGEEPYWEPHYRTPEYDWWRIECEALGVHAGVSPAEDHRPTLSCIEFVGVVDGKHQCRPNMTASDSQEDSDHEKE
jgi:hypothetical protein